MHLEITGLKEVLRSASDADKALRTGLRQAVAHAVAYGADEAKRLAPYKTGKLYDSIDGRMVPGGTALHVGFVEALADHAIFVEESTQPHVIEAKNAPALRFRARDGSWVSTGKVNHPGTKAQPFMAPAEAVVESTLKSRTQDAVNAAIAKF